MIERAHGLLQERGLVREPALEARWPEIIGCILGFVRMRRIQHERIEVLARALLARTEIELDPLIVVLVLRELAVPAVARGLRRRRRSRRVRADPLRLPVPLAVETDAETRD